MASTTRTALDAKDLEKVSGGNNYIQGSPEADFIMPPGDTASIVEGAGGADTIIGGAGNDQAYGGTGDDQIHMGDGNDLAWGGVGNDAIAGGRGSDQVYGEAGDDNLSGGIDDRANDLAFGGEGNDTFHWAPNSGSDQFHGEAGNDTLRIGFVGDQQLTSALQVWDGGLQMSMNADREITFTNAAGEPQSFSGQITLGGETLQFFNIEKIQLSGYPR